MRYEPETIEKLMYYDTEGIISSFPLFIFRQKQDSDREALARAVAAAIRAYPLFGCRLREDTGGPYLETNPEPPLVPELDPAVPFFYGTAASRYYPWVIGLRGRDIIYTGFHGLADGMGVLTFLRAVFRAYFEELGIDCGPADPLPDPQRTTELSTLLHGETEVSVPERPRPLLPSQIPAELFEPDPEKHVLTRLVINKADVQARARESGVSSFAVLAPCLGRAAAAALPGEDTRVKLMIIADKRKYLNSVTTHNCVRNYDFYYDAARLDALPIGQVRQLFRDEFRRRFTEEDILHSCYRSAQLEQRIAGSGKAAAEASAAMTAKFSQSGPVAEVTYTHMTRIGFPPELLKQFEDIYLNSSGIRLPVHSPLPLSVTLTAGERINFTLMEALRDGPILQAFMRELSAEGITCEAVPLERWKGILFKKQETAAAVS